MSEVTIPNAFIDVTLLCPARCWFCYLREGRENRKMSFKDFEVVVERLVDWFKVQNVTFLGGEPLTLSDEELLARVRLCQDYGIERVNLETSGFLLLKHNLKVLQEFSTIYVSIDYVTSKHEQVRGLPIFSVVKEVLKRKLLDNLGFTSVFLLDNFEDIFQLATFCSSHEIPYYVKTLKPSYKELFTGTNGVNVEKVMSEVRWKILRLYNMIMILSDYYFSGDLSELMVVDEPSYCMYIYEVCEKLTKRRSQRVDPRCHALEGVISVRVDGTINICPYTTKLEHQVGNIIEEDYDDLVLRIKNFRKYKEKYRCNYCKTCPYSSVCTGCFISDNEHCPLKHQLHLRLPLYSN